MQGHRGTIGSLPEALNFDHGSASNSAGIDPQICWSGIHNTGENRLPNYMLSPNDANITFVNPIYHEQQDLNRWSHGESSSSGTKNEVCHDEQKSEHGWSSSAGACAGAVPRSEGRRNDSVGVNPLFAECSNSNIVVQNLNLNTGFMGNDGDGNQNMEHTNFHKSSRSENEQVSPARGSEYLVEHNGGRPGCALEGRRTSCKRKALEGSVGQSSSSGNCNDFQRAESSVSTALSPCYNAGSGLSISSSSEQVNPRLVLGSRGMASGSIPDSTVTGAVEGSHRNFRLRINHSNQQESINPTLFQSGIVRHSSTSTSQQSSSLLPVDHSLDLRSAPAVDNLNCQSQNTAIHVPALTRNVHPFRWSGGPTSRAGSSTSSMSVDRDAMPREETRSRNLARNMADNHLFMPVPDFRNSIRNPTNRGLTGLNIGIPGNIASTSRVASSSGVQPSPGRLIKYDKKTGETTVLLKGLGFPNGVALSKDRSFVIVAESTSFRVLRYWLRGPKAGKHELFANLPGSPDNIRRNENGEFWVAMYTRKTLFAYMSFTYPWFGNTMLKLLKFDQINSLLIGGTPHGLAAKLGESGEILEVLEDIKGKTVSFISEVLERDGKLWMGSITTPYIGIYDYHN